MKTDPFRKLFQFSGPLLSLTLIGILLLSAVLYYRAVKIQRFLEPALAISTPRVAFARNVRQIIMKEFGSERIPGIRVTTSSIFVEGSLFYVTREPEHSSEILKKLSSVFTSVLKEPEMNDYVDFILVSAKFAAGTDSASNESRRAEAQYRAGAVLNSLLQASPELENKYGAYFSAAAVPVDSPEKDTAWIEFRFLPSEQLHIEVLKSLQKYYR